MILVHSSPKTLAPYRTPNLGVLCSPRCVYAEDIQDWPWAADNDAFSAWDEGRYREMLQVIRQRKGMKFVTAPDVVGDAMQTWRKFEQWWDEINDLPIAYVGQDGHDFEPPWDFISAFFVGGTTEWKMGPQAAHLMREAKDRGKWVHMGRVNSYERVRYARWLGCDSIDGTQFSWFRDAKLPAYLNALRQGMMIELPAEDGRKPAEGKAL